MKEFQKREIKLTDDGSPTIHMPLLNENYHSRFGAYTESQYVFIQAGLEKALEEFSSIRILEIGFGTGLNALLSISCLKKHIGKTIQYCGIEPYPMESQMLQQYHELSKIAIDENEWERFFKICRNNDGCYHSVSDSFQLKIIDQRFEDLEFDETFNLVYYDAFGPGTQPEMWEPDKMKRLYECMSPDGIFVTYCAQGQFKRGLHAAGFRIEPLPGPPGKRQMTRAIRLNF
jgi:tRNA U34 5-methylaminomethyl-2-thiouridine-forming methyltransferase MnmC